LSRRAFTSAVEWPSAERVAELFPLTVDEILSELRDAADPQRVVSLKRVNAAAPTLGVRLPSLRSLAKRIGHDHQLALELWQTPFREARILASLIDEPDRVTANQMDRWAMSFDNWEICDQVVRTSLRIPRSRSRRQSNGRDDPKSS
jgi:3-methyladenine DNA glycosylase AlkD